MSALLAALLLAFGPAAAAGARPSLGGPALASSELVFAPGEGLPGDALIDEASRAGPPQRLPRAPAAVVAAAPAAPARRGFYDVDMPISLESWANTLCVKGAWSFHGGGGGESASTLPEVLRYLEVSPAVLADGLRLGPGIGASTRF